MPAEIFDLVAMARLGPTIGTFLNITTFNTPPVAWTATGIAYSCGPLVAALSYMASRVLSLSFPVSGTFWSESRKQ